VTLVTLPGVEILATGTWALSTGDETFTTDDLEQAIDAASCPSIGHPVLKLGHVDPRFDGEPAVGRVTNLRLTSSGAKLTGDLSGMPGWLGEVAGSAYPNRSIEGSRNFVCQQGHSHPFVITALALLGVTRPGVGVLHGIDDVAALYDVAAASGIAGDSWRVIMGSTTVREHKLSPKEAKRMLADYPEGWRREAAREALQPFIGAEPATVQPPKVSAAQAAQAGAIIRRSISRGAISADRAAHFAERALGGEDLSWMDGLTAILPPVESADDYMHLYPPQPGKEREWEASKLAASAPRFEPEHDYAALYGVGRKARR
jgi:hypothetical protein